MAEVDEEEKRGQVGGYCAFLERTMQSIYADQQDVYNFAKHQSTKFDIDQNNSIGSNA